MSKHVCRNCLGVNPESCLFNPNSPYLNSRMCEIPHETFEEEEACEAMRLAIPNCPTCGPFRVESHPYRQIVRCANCKEWLV